MIRKLINLNKILSKQCERFRLSKVNIYKYYEESVHKYMTHDQTIVDIGGGKNSCIAKFKGEYSGIKFIAVDISDDELAVNTGVDEKIVADVTREIPLSDKNIDMIISSSVLEHLRGQEKFIKNASQILEMGGGGTLFMYSRRNFRYSH